MARAIANSSAQHCPNCGAFLNGDGTCSNPDCPGNGPAGGQNTSGPARKKAPANEHQAPKGIQGQSAPVLFSQPAPGPTLAPNFPSERNADGQTQKLLSKLCKSPLETIPPADAKELLKNGGFFSYGYITDGKGLKQVKIHWGTFLTNHLYKRGGGPQKGGRFVHPRKDIDGRLSFLALAVELTRSTIPYSDQRQNIKDRLIYRNTVPYKTKNGMKNRRVKVILEKRKSGYDVFDIMA